MKRLPLLIILLIIAKMQVINAQSYDTRLIPYPENATFKTEKFTLTSGFTLGITGNPDPRIYTAATRFLRRLDGRTGLFLSQPYITVADNNPNASLIIKINRPGVVTLNEDESYSISVSSSQINITADTDLGGMHALETMLQLLSADNGSYFFPSCDIQDHPRFAWRGLMIDVGRHFIPLEVIQRNLDAMAAVKLNVLHLHLTEDQGFRIESKVFPKLHELGSEGQYFSQEQIKGIIQYANDRGIRVIPEFDMPGHATSWFIGHPELASAPGPYKIERKLGVFDPTIDPTRETTYEFLDKFLGEMAQLFNDEYLHIGGDENNGKQWTNNPDIQAFMKTNNLATNHALQAYFNRRLMTILEKYHKKMIGWDEIMQPELSKTAVIQSWRGKEGLTAAAKSGYQVLLSNGYYIDLMQPAKDHYLNDPLPAGINLTEDQKRLILGGEATMWSELVTWETVDSRIWPRTAAIAERLWSPASIVNIENMYKKLEVISVQLEELGITHRKNIDMLLRRLCQDNDVAPLRSLVNLVEPVKFYERAGSREVAYRSFSPYTRFVDASQADAPEAMAFNSLVEKYLLSKNQTDYDKLQAILSKWISMPETVLPVIDKNPVLKEISPIVADVSKSALLGSDALKYIKKGKKAKKQWLDAANETLKTAKIHKAQMELKIVPGIEKLVEYAGK